MMATELVQPSCIKEQNMEIPSIPPGFESFATINIKKVEDGEAISTCTASTSASVTHPIQKQTQVESSDSKNKINLRRRSGISYCRLDDCSGDELNSDQNLMHISCLPKGVIRGCKNCSDCQTVTAKWCPEEACRPDLENAPIFYPNEEEFEDALAYIASIRPKAEKYGICRIVPPPSWKPPCPLVEKNMWEKSKFRTRVQRVDKLQNRNSVKRMLMAYNSKKKRRRCTKNMVNFTPGAGNELGSSGAGISEAGYFGFEPGPEFTLHSFQKYANDFNGKYFRKDDDMATNEDRWEPSVEDIEGEYWRMVEKPTVELEVLYGADLETGAFGSGFPTHTNPLCADSDKYVKSGWNLNNFPRLPGSVLSYESSDISGVLVPWLYIGMCFSSFCWHVEDHYLYSLNYMHWGAPKLWYGVPGEEAVRLEAVMRKHLPDLFEEQPDLLHKLVTQLSPSILKSEGVPVYRCVQNPGEFVLTFPRAYHSGFNCGFNCAEAVNVAPVDWLPHGYNAIELYRTQGRKTSISHDKLLLGAAREAVKAHWEIELLKKNISDNLKWKNVCGCDGILSKALKARIEMELVRRESLCISSHTVKMNNDFDAISERECCVCLYDLHLSAVGCHCSPDRYTCLYHANHLCSCSWNVKFYLFRYDVNELNILLAAVEGKLSAVYRWARLDLGLALSSQLSKDPQGTRTNCDLSHSTQGKAVSEKSSQPNLSSLEVIAKSEKMDKVPKISEIKGRDYPPKEQMSVEAVLALEAVPKPLLKVKLGNYSPVVKKESVNLGAFVPQISKQIGLSTDKKEFVSVNDNVILLSDDEVELSNSPSSGTEKQVSARTEEHSDTFKDSGETITASLHTENPKPDSNNFISKTTARCTRSAAEERNSCSLISDSLRGEGPVKCEMLTESNPINPFSYRVSTFTDSDKGIGTCDSNITDDRSDSNKALNGSNRQIIRLNTSLISSNDLHSVSFIPPNAEKNVDQYFRQKGPRIATVVRRINCNVEPLEYGVVQSGKFWCDSWAIFPKGFKSRVKYINVLDPTSTCFYVSEILDGGVDRPLFMVSLEHCPSEVFVHVSASKCWDMVLERVNQEITKQHRLGRARLHPLQPPKSLDGLEMFGFSSPAIVQAIQAMDKNQVCGEYWKSRPLHRLQHPPTKLNIENSSVTNEICNQQKRTKVDLVFGNLLDKANPTELEALYRLLGDNRSTTDQGLVTELLNQEINRRKL